MQAPFRHTLLYDGDCPICLASVKRLRAIDTANRLELLPNRDPGVAERFPHLRPEALSRSLHLVGPEADVWEGAEALERIAALMPGFSWVSWIFRIPFVRPMARVLYAGVARSRYRLSCAKHCSEGQASLPEE
jgi:predicted DCC family thiol-disulfide oxidoreductase YuxK